MCLAGTDCFGCPFFIDWRVFSYAVKIVENTGMHMQKKWREMGEGLPKTAVYLLIGVMLVMTGYLTVKGTAEFVMSSRVEKETVCIVLDAGHGGDDPGKVGINGALEKDLNLQITRRVKKLLETEGIRVVMTRTDEGGLYDAESENKKVQDMKRRVEIIEEESPVLTVSIHQNSYPEEYVRGAQVFFYKDSMESGRAAEIMQKSLKERVEPENKREAKANASYYLLKKTPSPIIIVECGFLSNMDEAGKLTEESYQERVAWAVFMGIMQTLNTQKSQ